MDTENILNEDWHDYHTVYLIRYDTDEDGNAVSKVWVHGIYAGETKAKAAGFDATKSHRDFHVVVLPTSAPLRLPH